MRSLQPTKRKNWKTAARSDLQGVKEKRWRILVGKDAEFTDQAVREDPESAYEPEFYERLAERNQWPGMENTK